MFLHNWDCVIPIEEFPAPAGHISPDFQWEQVWPDVSDLFIMLQLPALARGKGTRSRCYVLTGRTVPIYFII